jgi:tyrosinase
MVDNTDVQQRVNAFLTVPPGREDIRTFRFRVAPRRFSVFDEEQLQQSVELAARFMTIANSLNSQQDLHPVLDEAEQEAAVADPELVRHALMIFLTHHPRGNELQIPSIEQRAPTEVLPSHPPGALRARDRKVPPSETLLGWFREDPKINEHHEHWHVVYPYGGIPDPTDPTIKHTKDRQGELFLYMHQQMLARYDTERLAVGLPSVVPLSDYQAPIAEGYDPGSHLEIGAAHFSPRPPGERLGDLGRPGTPKFISVSRLEQWREQLEHAADTGSFLDGSPIDPDKFPHLFGSTIEASVDSVSKSVFGNLHNLGHNFLAYINDPQHYESSTDIPGVMTAPRTALRDPVFYRWHKHIDDIAFGRHAPPHDFSDAPSVLVRKSLNGSAALHQSPDIILCFKESIQSGADDSDASWQSYGEIQFGGTNWDTDFSASQLTTSELHTMMCTRRFTFVENNRATVDLEYLYPKEFFYFLRVENQLDHAQDVTVRIFLVAETFAEDRRKWIEMDKFRHTLHPSERAVIFRRAEASSVIRKPAVKTLAPVEIPATFHPPGSPVGTIAADPKAPANYCDCGWPYNLLLPRGTREGMKFRLLVMLTDWTIDQVADDTTCGSMSYCGAKEKYPDSRAMGYPFDRPFPADQTLEQTLSSHNNMAMRDITIKWVDGPCP